MLNYVDFELFFTQFCEVFEGHGFGHVEFVMLESASLCLFVVSVVFWVSRVVVMWVSVSIFVARARDFAWIET